MSHQFSRISTDQNHYSSVNSLVMKVPRENSFESVAEASA